jgi:hypothetical protein
MIMQRVIGACTYEFNPSERYRAPGGGEQCGRPTYAIEDVPEILVQPLPDGSAQVVTTGRKLSREVADPYCPLHGGTRDPDAPALAAPVAIGEGPGGASTAEDAPPGTGEEGQA